MKRYRRTDAPAECKSRNKPMGKVLHIAHLISPLKLYGKEKWLLALLRHIKRSEFHCSVVMITGEERPPLSGRLEGDGVVYSVVPFRPFSLHTCIGDISAAVTAYGADIIHTHDYRADILGYFAAKRARARIISTPHGWSNAPDVKLQAYQMFNRLLLPFFDRVVPLSPRLHSDMKRYCRGNLRMINNFVDLSSLPAPRTSASPLVSFVGRLIRLKRIQDAITALRFTRNTSIRLQIIGDGPCRRRLEELAMRLGLGERVTFLGFREDALDLLNESAVLVLPSLTEGLSRVAMEAMALGKPVVGTDIPGIRILIEDGKTGMLVSKKDPRAIARALDSLFSNRDLYSVMSRSARELILREHEAGIAVRRYEELYRDVVGG